jgi:hypothetical protein
MTCQFLSEYHVDVEKFNRAIGRSALLKDNLKIHEKNPSGICRDNYRPDNLAPRVVGYYLMN